jgi:hypothetical protein
MLTYDWTRQHRPRPREAQIGVNPAMTMSSTDVMASVSEPGDDELVRACLHGEQAAWNQVVERYALLVYTIPRAYGFSISMAEDVFQAVFTHLFNRLADLKQHASLMAWLIATTEHECQRRRRGD